MKKGWEIKKLGDVCDIVNGGTPKTNIQEYWDGDICWITPADLGKLISPVVGSTPRKISELGLQKSSAKLFPANSVILSTRAPIGHLAINSVTMATNQGCRGIVPKSEINNWYLFYFLKSNVQLLDSLGTGATFKELSTKSLSDVKIPIPSFPEQQRIVSILDKCFEAIDKAKSNAERNLQNANELFESYLNEVFKNKDERWKPTTLLELCDEKGDIVGGPFGSNLKVEHYLDNGVPILRLQNIGKGYFINKHIKYISEEKASELAYHSFKSGDIALAKLGIPIGKTCIIPDEFPQGIVVADVVRIRPSKKKVDYNFLTYFLNSSLSVSQLTGNISGATRPRVNIVDVRSIQISVPPLKIQQSVVENLRTLQLKTEHIKAQYHQKINDLEELRKSILQKAFSGELNTENIEI